MGQSWKTSGEIVLAFARYDPSGRLLSLVERGSLKVRALVFGASKTEAFYKARDGFFDRIIVLHKERQKQGAKDPVKYLTSAVAEEVLTRRTSCINKGWSLKAPASLLTAFAVAKGVGIPLRALRAILKRVVPIMWAEEEILLTSIIERGEASLPLIDQHVSPRVADNVRLAFGL